MKTFLLTSFLLTFVFLVPGLAQNNEPPETNGYWQYQPTKVETYLYNTEKFNFDTDTEADSIPESLTEFDYTEDKITATSSVYSEAQWVKELQTEMYLRNESMIDSMIIMMYDTASMVWNGSFKMANTYEAGMQTMAKTYAADSLTGEWKLLSQTEFEHNNAGHKTAEVMSSFIPDSNRMVVTSKTDFFVDANGRLDSTKNYFKVPVFDWMLNIQNNYYYNANGTLDYQETMSLDFFTQTLAPSSKTTYSYNSEGNQHVQKSYSWNPATLNYAMESKDSTVYDGDNRPLVQITMQKPLAENTLYIYQKTYFTYGTPSFINEAFEKSLVSVYPNPATDYIRVNTKSINDNRIQLFNLDGKLILDKSSMEKITEIPVQHLTKGSYLLNVQSDSKTHSQIVIVR